MNFDPIPFDVAQGLLDWALVFGVIALAGLLIGLIFAVVNTGTAAPRRTLGQLKRFGRDLLRTSPRRIYAIATLAFRDSLRRKALLVFVIFFLLFMFAGWFISETNTRPEMQVKVHVSFVLHSITWLILPAMLLLSCWGLPEDIKARSLHTVVTKPTRKHEIYIGRILGLSAIATLMLAVMGVVGYVWTTRQVPKEIQEKELICRVPVYGDLSFVDPRGNPQVKGINVGDMWAFRSYIAGGTKAQAIWEFDGVTERRFGKEIIIESRMEAFRTHKGVQKRGLECEISLLNNLREQTALALAVSQKLPQLHDSLAAGNYTTAADDLRRFARGLEGGRAKLSKGDFEKAAAGYASFAAILEPFRESRPDDAWIGKMIEVTKKCKVAATEAAATRSFGELSEAVLELAGVFEANTQSLGEILVDKVAKLPSFEIQEFGDPHQQPIKSTVTYIVNGAADAPKTGDIFENFVHGGHLRIAVRGLEAGQYIGMARPDLFIRMPDRLFWVGYSKAVVGIWLMTILVIILGVTASCFVKGPVATLLTFMLVLWGSYAHSFLEELVKGEMRGRGSISAAYRIGQHMNPQTELKDIPAIEFIKIADNALLGVAWGVHKIVPNFNNFRTAPYVANGFDVPWGPALLPAILTVIAFFVPCLIIGYFSLNLRELEEK